MPKGIYKRTPQMNENMRKAMVGRVVTWGDRISKGKKGKPSWNKGKKMTEEHRRHLSEARMRMCESLPQWKGDKVKRGALHEWVRKRLPKPKLCVCCELRPPRDLANISQGYRRDINDFEWLCRKCHIKKENRYKNNGRPKGKRDEKGKFI